MPTLVPELADQLRRRQRRGQDVRHDRLAGGLADRPGRRGQGRHQPAVARHLQRVQRRPRSPRWPPSPATCRRSPRCVRRSTDAGRPSSRMLNEIPGVVCPEPKGAFYAYPSVKGVLGQGDRAGVRPSTSAELAELILDEAEVAVVPGRGVRRARLPPPVVRARRRRPGRGRDADRQAARLSPAAPWRDAAGSREPGSSGPART